MIGFVVVVVVALALSIRQIRRWLLERIKAWSDTLIVNLLRRTSRFGSDLTEDGKAEQISWREQRLRNLHGLALRSKEAFRDQQSVKKGQEK